MLPMPKALQASLVALLYRHDKGHERLSHDSLAAGTGKLTQPRLVVERGRCKMRENQKLHVSSVGDRAEVVGAGMGLEQVTELRVLRGRSLCGEEASSPVQVNRLVDEYVRALCKLDEIRVAIGVPGDNHSTGRRVEAKCDGKIGA